MRLISLLRNLLGQMRVFRVEAPSGFRNQGHRTFDPARQAELLVMHNGAAEPTVTCSLRWRGVEYPFNAEYRIRMPAGSQAADDQVITWWVSAIGQVWRWEAGRTTYEDSKGYARLSPDERAELAQLIREALLTYRYFHGQGRGRAQVIMQGDPEWMET